MFKLYTDAGNFRAFKALIAAEYSEVSVDVQTLTVPKDSSTPEFLKKSPLGRVPVLETKDGAIFESNAIGKLLDTNCVRNCSCNCVRALCW